MLVAYCRLCRHCHNLAKGGSLLLWFHFTRCRYFFGPCRLSEFTLAGPVCRSHLPRPLTLVRPTETWDYLTLMSGNCIYKPTNGLGLCNMHYQMYSTDFFQGLTLESRFTNVTESYSTVSGTSQTTYWWTQAKLAMTQSMTGQLTIWLMIMFNCGNRQIEMYQWRYKSS